MERARKFIKAGIGPEKKKCFVVLVGQLFVNMYMNKSQVAFSVNNVGFSLLSYCFALSLQM